MCRPPGQRRDACGDRGTGEKRGLLNGLVWSDLRTPAAGTGTSRVLPYLPPDLRYPGRYFINYGTSACSGQFLMLDNHPTYLLCTSIGRYLLMLTKPHRYLIMRHITGAQEMAELGQCLALLASTYQKKSTNAVGSHFPLAVPE